MRGAFAFCLPQALRCCSKSVHGDDHLAGHILNLPKVFVINGMFIEDINHSSVTTYKFVNFQNLQISHRATTPVREEGLFVISEEQFWVAVNKLLDRGLIWPDTVTKKTVTSRTIPMINRADLKMLICGCIAMRKRVKPKYCGIHIFCAKRPTIYYILAVISRVIL